MVFSMLELRDIHAYYGNIHALKGLTLQVEQGEIVTLIGANGAGKSTTIRSITGLLRPRHGQIMLEGQHIEQLLPHQIVQRGVAQAPEGRRIFPRLTVLENLEMGAYTRTDLTAVRTDLDRVLHLFPRLKERASQQGGTLSGGEQQMLAIGRALMARPRVLLLDEQNALMALEVAHRGYVLQTGRTVLHDTAANLLQNAMVRKVYLGIE